MRLLFVLFILLSTNLQGQDTFKLSGTIENATVDQVTITLYRNWVQPPEEFVLKLNNQGQFYFNTLISEIAYLDFNNGLDGLLFQVIEPNDEINLDFDAGKFHESLKPSGEGAEKWNYSIQSELNFADFGDIYFSDLLKNQPHKYLNFVREMEEAELAFLEKHREKLSESAFRVFRADISGKYNSRRLDFYVKSDQNDLFDRFETKAIAGEMQSSSFEYGHFIERLALAQRRQLKTISVIDPYQDYYYFKYCFEKALITKPVTERLLGTQLVNILRGTGVSRETKAVFRDFFEFNDQESFENYLTAQLELQEIKETGGKAPDFRLTNTSNKEFSLKDFKGNFVLMVFWASWCQPCMDDLEYLPLIENYFKRKAGLKVVNIAIDTPEAFAEVASKGSYGNYGSRISPNSKFLREYGIQTMPYYVLLDKQGHWVTDDLMPPSMDEGRGIIKQLESEILK
ncbi:TlpA family protein disulfide reductase [Jiulongibacter sp. NS-SX5]|uniref:TlpA family protein disulfide reductase n=1 Tax=Jiulongibacter sp. NS-SX5 TaxID=3463854 RepID=UPI004059D96B